MRATVKRPPWDPSHTAWCAATVLLILLGVWMVFSASLPMATLTFGNPHHVLHQHLLHVGVAVCALLIGLNIPLLVWQKHTPRLMALALMLLVLVLVPGAGRTLNGSTRWLALPGWGLQVAEGVKFVFVLWMAHALHQAPQGGYRAHEPLWQSGVIFTIAAVLLLLEPDFGSVVVLGVVLLGTLWVAGLSWRWFFGGGLLLLLIAALLIGWAPYRWARLISFLDPWSDQYRTGYQLVQALMAFGRGGWFGVGLGSSVQKMFYLPEAYTDFLFAVWAEETGVFGALGVVLLYAFWIGHVFYVSRMAQQRMAWFEAYVALGVGCWFAAQVCINLGVNTGMLPTKGLTLPWLSYGGSSMLFVGLATGVIARIELERCAIPVRKNPVLRV